MSSTGAKSSIKLNYIKTASVCLTGVCRNACTYCLCREPLQAGSNFKDEVDVAHILEEANRQEARRLIILSGEWPDKEKPALKELKSRGYPSFARYLEHLCDQAYTSGLLPLLCVGYLFKEDLEKLKDKIGGVCVIVESVERSGEEHRNSPGKDPKFRLSFMENAARLKIPVTTGIMVGKDIPRQRWQNALAVIRNFQNEWGAVQEFLIQNCLTLESEAESENPLVVEEVIAAARAARLSLPGVPVSVGWQEGLMALEQAENQEDLCFTEMHDESSLIFDTLPETMLHALKMKLKENTRTAAGIRFKNRFPVFPRLFNKGFYPLRVRQWVQQRLTKRRPAVR